MAGYFGDDRLRISRARLLLLPPALFLGWFYAFHVRYYTLRDSLSGGLSEVFPQLLLSVGLFVLIIFLFMQLGRLFHCIHWLGKNVPLMVDILISRFIEVVVTIPFLILLITLASLNHKPDIYFTMVIIGLFSWTGIARLMRVQTMRTRNMEFIESARALGLRQARIIFRHALPNSVAPVLVLLVLGIAGAIIMESSLSFLGIGVSSQSVSWGSLLRRAREDTGSWWLTVFPGLAIFITITSFNLLGEGLRDAMDPREVQDIK
jgi:peptide/nickel transport system permease protein